MKKKMMKFLYILAVVLIISGTLFVLPGVVFAGDGPGLFTITVTAGPNGSISPGTYNAIPKNSDPSYIITANSDYNIASVTVDGASIPGPFTSPFTYTFSQVKEDHSIEASFAEIPSGTVNVTGVSLDKDTLNLDEGATGQISATVEPSDATNKNVTWETGDAGVATVDSNGLVTANKKGDTVITVRTVDGNFTDTCNVNVSKNNGGGDTDNGSGGIDVKVDWSGVNDSGFADLSSCTNGYWHWILTPGGATPTSGTLYVIYDDPSTSVTSSVNNAGSLDFDVYHSGAKVVSAYVIYSYTGVINGNVVLTISSSNCVIEEPKVGKLIIHKETDTNILKGTTFTFTVDGTTSSITTDTDVMDGGNLIGYTGPPNEIVLPIGYYTVSENDPGSDYYTWVKEGSGSYPTDQDDSIDITIAEGQTTEVWFYNDPSKEEVRTCTLTITKVVDNITDDTTPFDFELYNEGGLYDSGTLAETDGTYTDNTIPPSEYRLDEVNLPAGYSLIGMSATLNGVPLVDGNSGTSGFEFAIEAGDVVEIVITNTYEVEHGQSDHGTVTITKNIDVAQDTDTEFIFRVYVESGSLGVDPSYTVTVPAHTLTGSIVVTEWPFGHTYTITEDPKNGWTLSGSTNTNFILTGNNTVNPTFTNTKNSEIPGGGTTTTNNTPTATTTAATDTGGGGVLGVAGPTEGIQVLAFTGMDPIIPIAGGSAVIAGLAMLLATLRRRVNKK